MKEGEQKVVIDELQRLIDEVKCTIARFEASGMDTRMPDDYDRLLSILGDAVKQQRQHVLAMLA
ncbi:MULTISPECIES: hypothetical protein [unclassified Halomonas]|uniref:hypothetical protein n=1 Tax=unclassified Halomonas TaxID=2609666 RepID=UPI000C9747CB|nr:MULTISPECIES: hypothetical protein [unclassified Halomonas]MAR71782.1 hypothetical protein [Halomonas sp.]|tara:strand:+ start:379 stop:570 length:192 start_codon:yes stop_codon:yes gene_type:complete